MRTSGDTDSSITAAPRSVHVLTAGLLIVGGSSAAMATGPVGAWWLVVPLAAALVVAETLQVEFRYGGDVRAVDVFEAVLAPVLLMFAGPVAVLLAVGSKAISQHRLGIERTKAMFNVAQWAAAVGVASVAYRAFAGADAGTAATLPALVVALIAFAVANEIAMAVVLCLAGRASMRQVLTDLLPGYVPHAVIWSVNAALGVLFAVAVAASPAAAFLLLAPLAFIRWSHQAFLAMHADRARLDGLARAVAALAVPIDPRDALPGFVDDVRTSFSSTTVELVQFEPLVVISSGEPAADGTQSGPLARLLVSSGEVGHFRAAARGDHVATALFAAGRHDALAAPLVRDGRTIGALVSYDRTGFEGFEAGEASVMAAMAAVATRAIEKSALLGVVVEERLKLAEIVDRSSDGILTLGAGGVVESWNPAMETMTGLDAANVVGTTRLAALRPRDEAGNQVRVERWIDDGIPAEVLITPVTGSDRWLACSSAVGSTGDTLVVVARDVTRAREIDQMKDEFIATVSHELRTPLATIRGFTELLDPPGAVAADVQAEALKRIRRGTSRLERLVANLLEVSRIEARSSSDVIPTTLDVRELIVRVVDEVQESWPEREIRVEIDSGPLHATASVLSSERVLINLLSNGLTYADDGPVVVRAVGDPDGVAISVRDHGPGIAAQDQGRIFERFERLDTPNQKAGTGLGLYISRALALSMGADLTMVSEPGAGAEFTLHLPALAPAPHSVLIDLSSAPWATPSSTSTPAPTSAR